MTSPQPLNNENVNGYYYINRISIGEKDKVDFIYQYVKYCNVFYQYNNCFNDCCTVKSILGNPTKFPKYGKFSKTFTMKTYGPEVSISPWQNKLLYVPWDKIEKINNCVYIEFHQAVYPIRVSIYELYNPGYIIEIWAQNSYNQWFLLWNGSRQIVPPTSRLFSPPLQMCNFKTKKLKLKFKHNMWNNYTMIDAVMLIGSSKLILLKENLEDSLHERRFNLFPLNENNLTPNYKKAHVDIDNLQKNFSELCIIYKKRNMRMTDYQINEKVSRKVILDYEQQRYSNRLALRSYLNCAMHTTLFANESQKLSRCSLSEFPDEIMLNILENLDLLSLCRISQVNKHFNNLTRDRLLYTYLNMRYICNNNKYISNIFSYFTPRCKYLKQLNLILCEFPVSDFVKFLDICGRHLTHLRLIKCQTVDEFVLLQISMICKNLKALDLTSYECEFLHLQNLENLEYLNLTNTLIDSKDLCKTLRRNQRMRELNLKNFWTENLNAVLTELRNSCRDLEVLNLKGMYISKSIDVLAGCKNLRKINLHIKDIITIDSLDSLFSSCQRLEEVHLSCVIHNYSDLEVLTSKNLIKLCLNNIRSPVTPNKYSIIFEQCPKLQEFYVACHISYCIIAQWKTEYPNVSVYRSFCKL